MKAQFVFNGTVICNSHLSIMPNKGDVIVHKGIAYEIDKKALHIDRGFEYWGFRLKETQ